MTFCVAQAILQLMILLYKCWNYKHVLPYLVQKSKLKFMVQEETRAATDKGYAALNTFFFVSD